MLEGQGLHALLKRGDAQVHDTYMGKVQLDTWGLTVTASAAFLVRGIYSSPLWRQKLIEMLIPQAARLLNGRCLAVKGFALETV